MGTSLETAPDFLDFLRCPSCHSSLSWSPGHDELVCGGCDNRYVGSPAEDYAVLMTPASGQGKKSVQLFWGDLAKQWYADNDARMTPEELNRQLDLVEAFFRHRGQMAVTEMPYENLEGKRVLEVGSGGGAHSCLFKRRGAEMVSLDITAERVMSTAGKLRLLEGRDSIAIQGDAENLPFSDNAFDIVYSNGVLHHSPDTRQCVQEVYRVLKPGGKAVIMLYARHSMLFWARLLPRTILNGTFFTLPEEERLGRVTEGKPVHGSTWNPITRVYSAKQIRDLMAAFDIKRIRKNSFQLYHLPIPKAYYPRIWLLRLFGVPYLDCADILYGPAPVVVDSRMELALAPYIGWGLNILAVKPE